MMESLGKKLRAGPTLSMDDPQNELINEVLVRMPLRDAVRTSILSRRWRYRWATVTQLEFATDSHRTDSELQDIIDRVLMLHVGPIHTFKVVAYLLAPAKVDLWLIFLSRNGIKKLVLELCRGVGTYTVHSCVFCCKSITHLDLDGCTVKLPSLFEGFPNLKFLQLACSRVSEGDFQRLISNCAILEELVLFDIMGCNCFKIGGRSLRVLRFDGEFTDFSLTETPVLSELSFKLDDEEADFSHMRGEGIFFMSKIMACADSIKKLSLGIFSLKFLKVGFEPEKFLVVFERLVRLKLSVTFTDKEESLLLLSLLRRSPNLRELKLRGNGYRLKSLDNKIFQISEDIEAFPSLRILKISRFTGIKPEMEFIEYALGHAPVLQRMYISLDDDEPYQDKIQVMAQLLLFDKASPVAKVIYGNG